MKHLLILFFVLISLQANTQSFYVTAPVNFPVGNKSFELNVSTCDTLPVYVCLPTNNISQYPENQFTDIAVDNNQNIYYVSGWGSLYSRSLNDTVSCQYLGSFGNSNSINAMVADSSGDIYAAGNMGGVCTLFKYSAGIFSTVGNLPPGCFSAGDLFFYEHRLFLTCTDTFLTSSYLTEVSLPDPQQSCYYMDLLNLQPYGAFSIRAGPVSNAYIICTNNPTSSSLREIDITNQTIGAPICTYPFLIGGAATYYNLTSNNTSCDSIEGIYNAAHSLIPYMNIQSPVSDLIRLQTNIDRSEFKNLYLFDIAGKKIKDFSEESFPGNLNVSDISAGIYILQLTTTKGAVYNQKFFKDYN
jgi:hypothetical protein